MLPPILKCWPICHWLSEATVVADDLRSSANYSWKSVKTIESYSNTQADCSSGSLSALLPWQTIEGPGFLLPWDQLDSYLCRLIASLQLIQLIWCYRQGKFNQIWFSCKKKKGSPDSVIWRSGQTGERKRRGLEKRKESGRCFVPGEFI